MMSIEHLTVGLDIFHQSAVLGTGIDCRLNVLAQENVSNSDSAKVSMRPHSIKSRSLHCIETPDIFDAVSNL